MGYAQMTFVLFEVSHWHFPPPSLPLICPVWLTCSLSYYCIFFTLLYPLYATSLLYSLLSFLCTRNIYQTYILFYIYQKYTRSIWVYSLLIQPPFFSGILPPSHSGVNEGHIRSRRNIMCSRYTYHIEAWRRIVRVRTDRTRETVSEGKQVEEQMGGGRDIKEQGIMTWRLVQKIIENGAKRLPHRDWLLQVHCTWNKQVHCSCVPEAYYKCTVSVRVHLRCVTSALYPFGSTADVYCV